MYLISGNIRSRKVNVANRRTHNKYIVIGKMSSVCKRFQETNLNFLVLQLIQSAKDDISARAEWLKN